MVDTGGFTVSGTAVTYPEDDKEILAYEAAAEWRTRALKAEESLLWFRNFHRRWIDLIGGMHNYRGWAEAIQDLAQWEHDNPKPENSR
jgi:hypothetical protein